LQERDGDVAPEIFSGASMTDRKHPKHKEQPGDSAPGGLEPEEGSAEPSMPVSGRDDGSVEALQILHQELAEAESKAKENLDGWQRAVAEFQNYKKRVERDREAEQSMMKGDFIKKVLPVLDDLERALQNRPAAGPWVDGIELIQRKLQSLLESEGVVRIEAEGEVFDPNFHEAISQEPVDGIESGHVVAIVQNGYMLGDRVVRPALVRVAK
jgi:molecular chaperone GrpE